MKKKKAIHTEQEIAIQLKHVTKQYIVHHEKPTFSEKIMRFHKDETFSALEDIDLTIYRGEKVGIVGRNGAGKTTLLKIISGITTPSKGTVITKGRIISLIDLEAGFHPDLSGEENIYLNGLVIGSTNREIKDMFKEIVAFADIGRFIDAPMYTYSTGMKLRLGFAIAVHSNPDILVLDEGIIVGDASFQLKTQHKIEELFRAGKTVLMVSHWIDKLKENCTKCLWLEKKHIYKFGSPSLFDLYEKKFQRDY